MVFSRFGQVPVHVILFVALWTTSEAQTEVTMRVPRTVDDCYAQALLHPIDPKSAKVDCLQRLMWFFEPDQNLTQRAYNYFSSLRGNNRGDPAPKTGFRTRREYRRLSDMERLKLHEAFNALYQRGILRRYADLHRNAVDSARDGAAFLAWHRVFLAMFEDELRLVDPTVALPYWDSTLDYNLDNPVNSVIWSLNLLGNANGEVNTGPFAGWITSRGRLWRHYGSDGTLISPEKIAKIMTRCQTDDIMFPLKATEDYAKYDYVMEFHSNGVHKWVGGDMGDGHFAAYDPLFYMHQAYIDFIWEYYRHKQKTVCGINPETAYASPPHRLGHGPDELMYGFTEFKNIDGLKDYWTKSWYDYEVTPDCPNCGSKFLFCDKRNNQCASHSRRTDFNMGRFQELPMAPEYGLTTEPFEPLSIVLPKRSTYTFLPTPLNDRRTRVTAHRDAKRVTLDRITNDAPPTQGPEPMALAPWVQNLETPPPGGPNTPPPPPPYSGPLNTPPPYSGPTPPPYSGPLNTPPPYPGPMNGPPGPPGPPPGPSGPPAPPPLPVSRGPIPRDTGRGMNPPPGPPPRGSRQIPRPPRKRQMGGLRP